MTTKTTRIEPVCKIRHVPPFERKHLAKDDRARFWVRCRLCPATSQLDTVFGFGRRGEHTLGWAFTLEDAIRFADAHASIHLDKQCPSCLHVPEVPVSVEDTSALVTARCAR